PRRSSIQVSQTMRKDRAANRSAELFSSTYVEGKNMKNHFPVKIFPSDDLLVFYPAVLNPPEKVCKVTFGTMTIEAECRAHPKQQNILAISSKAAEKLMLTGTPPVSLHLFFHDDTLY